jgi:hypothetical protein
MPTLGTVREWFDAREDFRTDYRRAREIVADRFAEQLLQIADDSEDDFVLRELPAGTTLVFNRENLQRDRLGIDTRKWLMAAYAPHKYGNGIAHETEEENATSGASQVSRTGTR